MHRIGRYEVIDHLASGGMGHVYLARATGPGGFERLAVIKTLDRLLTDNDEAFATMFLEEARLVGGLHHQFIAPVYEVGCDDEGGFYFVMDYVPGQTVEALWKASVARGARIPLELALTVGAAVAWALDYAHSFRASDGTPLEIVHRDVSLSNVILGHDGSVKLIDFGIAKAANRTSVTQVGALKGKIGYLAPEQILHRPTDRRTDIFALGIVLYELTTATRAFHDSSALNTFERVTRGEIAPPSEVIRGYPRSLERVVMRALEREPGDRFQDAGALARALEAIAASGGLQLGHCAVAAAMADLFPVDRHRRPRALGEHTTDVTTPLALDVDVGGELTASVLVELEDTPTGRFP